MTLYDEYRKAHPIAAEPSEFRGIIEAEAFRREQEEGLPAEDIKPGRYRMTQTTEMMVDVVEGIHGLFVMSDYWNLPIEQFYHSGVTFQADDNAEYIRADLVLSERHQRLVEAAREFLRVICSNTIQNNESLKAINALKAVLEGEKGAQETSCQATHE